MRKVLSFVVAVLLAGTLSACEQQPTTPDASLSAEEQGGVIEQTAEFASVPLADGDFAATGEVTVRRKPANNTMSWKIDASGLGARHAYTVWLGNFDDPALTNGGWGDGGLVGGDGQLTSSGNHCIWPLVTFTDGGFRPGKSPDCEKIDIEGQLFFFVLDHQAWEAGDVFEFWDPDDGTDAEETPDPGDLAGFLAASFEPLEQ